MSSATAIPISPDLVSAFNTQSHRYIVVKIANELLVKHHSHPKGGSLESDWNTIKDNVSGACYVLVQSEPSRWVTITYVPEGTPIRDKMVYAATKATLLNHLGYQHFQDDHHANSPNELTYGYFTQPVYSLSKTEEARDQVHREENEERTFRANQQNSRGIGGYHSVAMPFDATARSQVQGITSGTYNFVELAVNPAKNGIIGKNATNSQSFASLINKTEPRYYLIKHNSRNVFVYCCPEKSPQQLRMVYSTGKGSVMNEVKSLGFSVPRAGEITDASELTPSYLNEISAAGTPNATRSPAGPTRASVGEGGGIVKAQRQSVMGGAHPVYSLMGSPGSGGRTKKIVLPPPGAY